MKQYHTTASLPSDPFGGDTELRHAATSQDGHSAVANRFGQPGALSINSRSAAAIPPTSKMIKKKSGAPTTRQATTMLNKSGDSFENESPVNMLQMLGPRQQHLSTTKHAHLNHANLMAAMQRDTMTHRSGGESADVLMGGSSAHVYEAGSFNNEFGLNMRPTGLRAPNMHGYGVVMDNMFNSQQNLVQASEGAISASINSANYTSANRRGPYPGIISQVGVNEYKSRSDLRGPRSR